MATWLVTGGAGFIGGNFVLRTLEQDPACTIVNLDALTYAGNLETLSPLEGDNRHRFVHGDIGDGALVEQLLARYEPDAIINFAAESHVDRSIDGPSAFINTNVVGTLNLLERARDYWRALPPEKKQAFRFLHVSTDEVYGSLGESGAFTEETPYAPNSPYAASKASSDHLVRAFYKTYGLPVLTTNCSNNYGPYQFPEKLIPLMIHNALAKKPLPVYGDGRQVRDWLFVNDHVDAIRTVLAKGTPGQVYNVGGLSERANIEVVEAICDIVDERRPDPEFGSRRSLVRFVEDRPGHDRRYAIDCSKICGQLGWRPTVDFETGLALTVDWYLENSDWVEHVQDGSYQGQRLGLGKDGS